MTPRVLRRRRPPASVVLVTRVDCSLCAVAEPLVRRAADDAGLALEVVDVDADPALLSAYSDMVPVVLLDGAPHAYWTVDEKVLRKALRG